jgi:excinuclease ABC subunit C
MLQKVFQIRTCEPTVFANRSRPCMLFQIERCSAPCVGLIAASDYAADVERATLFLQGKTDQLLTELKDQMNAAAAELNFEKGGSACATGSIACSNCSRSSSSIRAPSATSTSSRSSPARD